MAGVPHLLGGVVVSTTYRCTNCNWRGVPPPYNGSRLPCHICGARLRKYRVQAKVDPYGQEGGRLARWAASLVALAELLPDPAPELLALSVLLREDGRATISWGAEKTVKK